MEWTPLLALTVVLVMFAIGDIFSVRTNAILSMLFVSSVLITAAFWSGFPADFLEMSQLIGIGVVLVGPLIVHMGTLIKIRDFIQQWKTVLIALAAVVGIAICVLVLGSPIFGRDLCLVAAPPIAGGVPATIMMADAARAKGLTELAIFATMLAVFQGFVGYPISSIFLTKEARRIVGSPELMKENLSLNTGNGQENDDQGFFGFRFPPVPEKYNTECVLLAKVALAALFSNWLSSLTNNTVHPLVMALIVGIVFRELGLLDDNILTKANSMGFIMVALLAVVFIDLAQATPEVVVKLLTPMLGTLALGVVGIALGCIVVGKLLGYSNNMAIPIGLSALYGFPGTYVLAIEAARAVATNEEERQAILNHILPKMLVAGFVTNTTSSVVLAGIFAKIMFN